MAPRRLPVLLLLLTLVVGPSLAAADWLTPVGRRGFSPPAPPGVDTSAFDLVASDLDRDGDDDLLINWHHLGPLELMENRRGRFVALDLNSSGLRDNPDFTSIFADSRAMRRTIAAAGHQGLFVWHTPDRAGPWCFQWENPRGDLGELRLQVDSQFGLLQLDGLAPEDLVQRTDLAAELRIATDVATRGFQLETRYVGIQLRLDWSASPVGGIPVYVGPDLIRVQAAQLSLWKDDPHGIAVANVRGSTRPEIYITRGAVLGLLQPPLDPKRDRLFTPTETGLGHVLDPRLVPPDYGRGRRVEWVDLTGDGSLDLSVTNLESPNRLLVWNDDGLEDRAAPLGLDHFDHDVLTWGDFDDDGLDDVFILTPDGILVLRNDGGTSFTPRPPADTGLTLSIRARREVFDTASLRLADFDADGRLDLWILGLGPAGGCHLFVRRESGFQDWTAQTGLAHRSGAAAATYTLVDLDNDGWEDVLELGETAVVWHNRAGERFEFVPLPQLIRGDTITAACATDVDDDGRMDIVAAGQRRHLFRNAVGNANAAVRLRPSAPVDPVGALVTAHYRSGRRLTRRYGSAANTIYSQTLQPLHFGVPTDDAITQIQIRWPGDSTALTYSTPEPGAVASIRR